MRDGPSEGWILAGTVDGAEARPALDEDVAGMPWLLRLACDLQAAGARRIVVVWNGDAPPAIEALVDDARLTASVTISTTPPAGADHDPILIVRSDRIFHRDTAKQVVKAWKESDASVARLEGGEHDAVFVTDRAHAAAAARNVSIEAALAGLPVATIEPPYLGFTTTAPDRQALRRAERRMVWSLRKRMDGLASAAINRHLSLPFSWLVMRTPIRPNHITVFCFALAVTGGVVISRGGWLCGVIGMLLVNLGSILDGSDGEIARLKYQFSKVGQWMDTLADDFGNVAYITGLAISLDMAGVSWAMPTAMIALGCFALTQTTQYALITLVYRSGDLAAIPWAFQSYDFLSARPSGFIAWIKLTAPKMLKRDFALTAFVVLALLGRLDVILVIFSGGAIVFFGVFAVQCARNLPSIVRAARGDA